MRFVPEAHCQMCAHKRAEKETAACGDASSLSRQRWPTIPHIMLCRISNAPHTSITAQNANITWHWSFSLYFKRLCYHAPNWNECCCSGRFQGFHLVSWWRALYGPPALGVWTSKSSDCKVNGAHTYVAKEASRRHTNLSEGLAISTECGCRRLASWRTKRSKQIIESRAQGGSQDKNEDTFLCLFLFLL